MKISFSALVRVALCLSVFPVVAFSSAPASAGALEKNIAQCASQQAPVSAQNWMSMEIPKQNLNFLKLANQDALGLRLLAICSTENPTPKMPKWKSLHKAVLKSLAKADPLGTGEDGVVELCTSTADVDGEIIPFKVDIAIVAQNDRNIVTTQHFGHTEKWGPVPLPRDLYTVPPADAKVATTCKKISSDGSLADA